MFSESSLKIESKIFIIIVMCHKKNCFSMEDVEE